MLLTTNPSVLMAGLVAIASAAVFAIRYVQPKASREYDIIFAVMGLIYAICLLLEGWRLIPLLFFAQVLVVVFGGFFAVETFRLRAQLVERSRQSAGRPQRESGFRRTYSPGHSSRPARTVINRQPGGARIRDANDPERTIENRESRRRRPTGSRPQLTDGDGSPRSPRRRPRPPQPEQDVDVMIDDQDYLDTNDRDNRYSDDWERSPGEGGNGSASESRPPRRRPPRPASEYDEDQDPRLSSMGSSRSRRRPPRLPEEEDFSSRPRVIRPEQIEVVDDEDFDEYYEE